MEEKEYFALKQKKKRIRFLCLGISLFLIIAHIINLHLYYHGPMDGIFGSTLGDNFQVEYVIFDYLKNDVQPNDIIKAVNNVPVMPEDESSNPTWFGGKEVFPRNQLKTGDTFVYTIEHDDETKNVEVRLQKITVGDFLKSNLINILVSITYVTLGLFVALKKPLDKNARILHLLCSLSIFELVGGNDFLSMTGSSITSFLSGFHWGGIYPLTVLLLAHFALEFPSSNYKPEHKKILYSTLYGSWIISAISYAIFSITSLPQLRYIAQTTVISLPSFYGLFALVMIFFTYRKTKDPIKKAQMRWLFWGFSIAGVLGFGFYQLGWIFYGKILISWEALIIVSLIIPFSIAIALIKYKLFAIDTIINKSLVYGLITASLTAVYLLNSILFSFILQKTLALDIPSFSDIINIIVILLLFTPLRTKSQEIIDKLFYKKKIVAQQFLNSLGENLATSTSFDGITQIMLVDVPRKLEVSKAWLFISGKQSSHFFSIEKQDRQTLDKFKILLQKYASQKSTGLELQYFNEEELEKNDPLLKEKGIEIIVPLKHANQLIGLYVLSKKKSEMPFSSEEIAVLKASSFQLAIALKNAQAFEALEQEKQHVEHIIKSISEGVIILDRRGRITQLNPAVMNLLYAKEKQLLGKKYDEIFHLLDKNKDPLEVDPIQQSLLERKEYQGNHWLQIRNKKENLVPTALFLDPLITEEKIFQGMILTVYDRTEEEQVLSIKDSFIATVGHELRTPLSIAKFTLELIAEQPFASNQQKKDFLTVNQAIERLATRVQQIIDTTSIQSGTAHIKCEPMDLTELLEEILRKYKAKADTKGLIISLNQRATVGTTPLADRKALKKILDMLVTNAIDFTDKGSINIRTSLSPHKKGLALPASKLKNKFVVIQVKDTGRGIDKMTQKHLFESFLQQGGALGRDETKGGLGLGLHLAKLLIEEQNGEIWYESEVDKGTAFYISIPLILNEKN